MSDSESDGVAVPKGSGRPRKVPKGPYIPTGKPRGRPKGPPKPPKAPKEKKPKEPKAPRVKPTHAPFTKLVEDAVRALYEKKGVSKALVVNYIMANEPECSDKIKVSKSVKTAIKRLVLQEVLVAPTKGKAQNWGQMLVGRFLLSDKGKKAEKPKPAGKRGKPKGSPKKAKPAKAKGTPKKAKPALKVKLASPKKAAKKKSAGSAKKKSAVSPKKAAGSPKKAAATSQKPAAKKGRGRPKKTQ